MANNEWIRRRLSGGDGGETAMILDIEDQQQQRQRPRQDDGYDDETGSKDRHHRSKEVWNNNRYYRYSQHVGPSQRRTLFVAICSVFGVLWLYGSYDNPMTTTRQRQDPTSRAASTTSMVPGIQLEHDRHRDATITECGIWMAPSSLRPDPGFGIFTTRHINHDESILHSPDAVTIPLHDMRRRTNMPLLDERRKLWRNVFGNVSV
jgi:hypothetical protein